MRPAGRPSTPNGIRLNALPSRLAAAMAGTLSPASTSAGSSDPPSPFPAAFQLDRAASIVRSVPQDHPVGAALTAMLDGSVPHLIEHVQPIVADKAALQAAVREETAAMRRPVVEGVAYELEVKAPLKLADEKMKAGSLDALLLWMDALPPRVLDKVRDAQAIELLRKHFSSRPVGKEAPLLAEVLAAVLKPALDTATVQDDDVLVQPRQTAEHLVQYLRTKSEAIQEAGSNPHLAPIRESHRNERLPRAIELLENKFGGLDTILEQLGSDGLSELTKLLKLSQAKVAACADSLREDQRLQEERVASCEKKMGEMQQYVCELERQFEMRQKQAGDNKPLLQNRLERALEALRAALKDLQDALDELRRDAEQLEDARVKLEEGRVIVDGYVKELTDIKKAHHKAAKRWASGQQVVSDIDKLAEGVVVRARTHLLDSCEAMLRDAPVDAHKCTGFLQQVINELRSQQTNRLRNLSTTHGLMVMQVREMEAWNECPLDDIPEDDSVVGVPTVFDTNKFARMEKKLKRLRTLYERQKADCQQLNSCITRVEAKVAILAEKQNALVPHTLKKKAGTNGAVLLQERPGLLEEPQTFSETDGTNWATEFFFTKIVTLDMLKDVPDADLYSARQVQLSPAMLSSVIGQTGAAALGGGTIATEQSEVDMGDWDEIRSTITVLTGAATNNTQSPTRRL